MTRTTGILRAGVLLAVLAAGCTSPEATRRRGGGPGADPQNRPATVKMHEGSEPFWKTPRRIGEAHAPLESSRQAESLSRQ